MPGKSRLIYNRRMYGSVGDLQSCVPLSLHIKVVKDPPSVPPGQQRLGVPEVRAVEIKADWNAGADNTIHKCGFQFFAPAWTNSWNTPNFIISGGVEVITYRFIGFYIDPVSR